MKFVLCLVIAAVAFASANIDEYRDAMRDVLSNYEVQKRALTKALNSVDILKAAKAFGANLGKSNSIATGQSQTFIDSCLGAQTKPFIGRPTFGPIRFPWNNIIKGKREAPFRPIWTTRRTTPRPTFRPIWTIRRTTFRPIWTTRRPFGIGKREATATLANRDVVFVLDTSGSIPQAQFDKAKKSIVALMESYCPTEFGSQIKASGTKQIAVVLFDGRVTTEVDFSEASKGFGFLQDKIMSIKHRKGSTATANALRYVRHNVLGKGASRLSNEQVATDVIVITDGQCNTNCGGLGNEANSIRKMGHGVNLFAMGVGRARACELEIITGDAKDVGFDLGNFSNFDSFAIALKSLAAESEKKCV